MPFENLLAAIADDGERNSLKAISEKYPAVKRYAELGEQVEPLLPRVKALQYETLPPVVEELEKWRHFKETDWPMWEQEHSRVRTSLAEATAEVEKLRARGELDMTAEDVKKLIDESLTAKGVVDVNTLTSKLTEFRDKEIRPELNSTINGWGNRFQEVYQKLTPKFGAHEKTFGEALDAPAVFEHMKKLAEAKKTSMANIDPDEAYNDFYKDKFAARDTATREAEKKAAREEGIAEGRKQAAALSGHSPTIVDGGGGGRKLGPLQRRQLERLKPKEGDAIEAPLGKGIISQQYVQKKVEKEMSGSAV